MRETLAKVSQWKNSQFTVQKDKTAEPDENFLIQPIM